MSRSILQKSNRLGVLSLSFAVAVLTAYPLAATASKGPSVLWVAPARVDAPLESIGLGYAEWLRQQLEGAGLAVAGKLAAASVGTHGLSPSAPPAPNPQDLDLTISEDLAQLILALLTKRREDRPADAAEVAARLQPTLSALT